MASSRDRLRAASKKNAQEHKRTDNQPTLVSDMVNQLNDITPIMNEPKTPSQDEPVKVNDPAITNTATPVEKPSQENAVVAEAPSQGEPVKVNNPVMPTTATPVEKSSQKNVAVAEEPIVKASDNAQAVNTQDKTVSQQAAFESIAGVPMISIDEYEEDNCLIALQVVPEISNFLAQTASKLRIPIKTYFKILMVNEIANGEIATDALSDSYRIQQHGTVRRSILTNIELREAIKELAAANSMKYTPFMAYVIHKAMLNVQKNSQ